MTVMYTTSGNNYTFTSCSILSVHFHFILYAEEASD